MNPHRPRSFPGGYNIVLIQLGGESKLFPVLLYQSTLIFTLEPARTFHIYPESVAPNVLGIAT